MKHRGKIVRAVLIVGIVLSGLVGIGLRAQQDKYTLKVPGGLAFSEFRGYESWQAVSISQNGNAVALILGNPVMIDAYRAGVPGNGKPFPDGCPNQSGGIEGTVNVHHIEFSTKTHNVLTFRGTIEGNSMSGLYGLHGRHAEWRAVREN